MSAADSSLVSEKLNSSYAAEHGTAPEDISAAAHAASAGFFTCDDCIPFFPPSGEGISVNSYHHQAVKEISPKLTACAAASDGLIEALEAPDRRFFIGVQWHPELFYKKDEASRRLFCEFVEACK